MKKKPDRSAFEQALLILERSMKSKKQLEDALYAKGYSHEEITSAFEKLEEYRFVDDEKFGQTFVEINGRTKGKRRIQAELAQKGISQEIIESSTEMLDRESETEKAFALAERRFKGQKDKAKIYRFLVYRGFDGEVCRDVIEKLVGLAEDSCDEDISVNSVDFDSQTSSCVTDDAEYIRDNTATGNLCEKTDKRKSFCEKEPEDFDTQVMRAYALVEKKYKSDFDRNKVWRFLLYRKFSGDVIKAVIAKFMQPDDYGE